MRWNSAGHAHGRALALSLLTAITLDACRAADGASTCEPFRIIQVDWNPTGHEPEGVYSGFPHFDFHFYTVSRAEVAVPMMGVHWSDVRSPELQHMLGNSEAYRPFTATIINGSWNGRFTFREPMITRAHMLAKKTATDPAVRDQILPIAGPAKYHLPGSCPTAYRITWDAGAREYRVALAGLTRPE